MAGLATAEKQALMTKFGTDTTFASLHTGDPGTPPAASNEVTGGSPAYARKAISWSAPDTSGQMTATVVFDVPAGTYTFVGLCSASSGGTVVDSVAITSATFSGQGTFTVTLTAKMP